MVFFEGGENSGVFYNTDDDDDANIVVADYAKRGTSATFDYNDSAQSFVVANDFGVIDMEEESVGDVWNSGEALTVTLIDQDLNKNSASDEDLVLTNTTNTHLIPSLQIGSPLTVDTTDAQIVAVTSFSKIAYYTNATIGTGDDEGGNPAMGTYTKPYIFNTGYTGTDLNAIDTVNTYFNWNVASFFNSTTIDARVCLSEGSGHDIVCGTGQSGITEIDSDGVTAAGTKVLYVNVTRNAEPYGKVHGISNAPVIADVFSFGAAGLKGLLVC
jgi:hypothetical protein